MKSDMHLREDAFTEQVPKEPIRKGFGRGLLEAGKRDEQVVALCADLTDSTQMSLFKEEFPDRFIEVGVAEQNLVTVSSGMSALGYIPFCSSYAAFSPGRNWEQIRTTIALNDRPVKIVGSHAGISVGPDGATHQMLEDIALMRVLPNMVVVAPGDSVEAEKATMALAQDKRPGYIRLARDKSPIFTTDKTPFTLGKAYVLREGHDITLLGTGAMTYQLLAAAKMLAGDGIEAEVVHVPTIKPLDEKTIIQSVKKTGRALSAEEGQAAAGFGSAIAELLTEQLPTPLKRIGIPDIFGESGKPEELLKHFGLTGTQMALQIHDFIANTPQYHQ
ncbi:MAG TPA: transketolase C-terminal domain-containing protein [Verrucomicrobiae bacterium]|nr:transketolase C-terminal domain-containing protein [Verrucomicrobiae bacterium]